VALNLGVCLEKLGQSGEAERSYRRALLLNPRYTRAHFNIGVLYWKKDLRQAVREFEAALRIDPNDAQSRKYYEIARRRLSQKNR